jgi:hypothetical protein
MGKFSGS